MLITRSLCSAIAMTFILLPEKCFSQDSSAYVKVPFWALFENAGGNAIHSLEYHYGLNYLGAGLLSYGIVASGVDWDWYRLSVRHKWIGTAGFASVTAGGLVPLTLPLGLYLYGLFREKPDDQITGLALGQAALLGLAVSSGIKVFTGRVPPDNLSEPRDYSGDFRFGVWRGGAFEGWPSSHTTIAFAMAAAFAELNPQNQGLGMCGLAYASLIGLGVSTNIHWLSDAVAGGLIGYAIGYSVGSGFAKAKVRWMKGKSVKLTLSPVPNGLVFGF